MSHVAPVRFPIQIGIIMKNTFIKGEKKLNKINIKKIKST